MGIDDPCFHRDDDEMLEASLDWTNPALEGITLERLKAEGYARLNVPARPTTTRRTREGKFPTPSGKCEFEASMAAGGNFVVPLFRQGYNGNQDGDAGGSFAGLHPAERGPAATPALAKRYPLSLISPKSHAFLNSNYGNLPAQTAQAGEEQ